ATTRPRPTCRARRRRRCRCARPRGPTTRWAWAMIRKGTAASLPRSLALASCWSGSNFEHPVERRLGGAPAAAEPGGAEDLGPLGVAHLVAESATSLVGQRRREADGG